MLLQKSSCFSCCFKTLDISQGSVATNLKCGGIFSDSIITIFFLIPIVKYNFENRLIFDEVKAYQKSVPFLGHPVCATARLNILSLRGLNANHSNRDLLIAASLKKQLIY